MLWSALVACSLLLNIYQLQQEVAALADVEAQSNLSLNKALRRWASSHGGIYLQVSENTVPNPYMKAFPGRDVRTVDGRTFTLFNPATVLREIMEIGSSEDTGMMGRITARLTINPANRPDPWEERTLAIVEQSLQDFSETTVIDGRHYVRRMQPLFMEKRCLDCHSGWGSIPIGGVAGASDVAVPLDKYTAVVSKTRWLLLATHSGIWLLGLGLISLVSIRSYRHAVTSGVQQTLLRKLNSAVDQSANGILITDMRGTIEYVNAKFCEVNGYSREDVVGQNPRFLKSNENSDALYQEMWTTLLQGQGWRGELRNRKKSGEIYWCMETISPIRNELGEVTHYLAVIEDVSERKFAEETIHRLAYYDPLTDLPNRRLLRDHLESAVAWSRRAETGVALFYIDLDRFKTVNDTLGHAIGDALLMAAAGRLKTSIRENDTLARLGGDEFAVVVGNVRNNDDAATVAEKLIEAVRQPFDIDGHELHVTTSVGIALYPQDTDDIDTLIRHADAAMYQAKGEGKNTYRFFAKELSKFSVEHLALENGLRKAVARQELVLEYQPKLDLRTWRVCGMEALVRWEHPTLGRVSPARFIPLAEEIGEIPAIGEWVLREACRQLQQWRLAFPELSVSVNLSAMQFRQPDLPDRIAAILKETGLPPGALELEITESALVDNPSQAVLTLRALRGLGVSISIDDFGTGYSSLSYLKNFPVNVLKIDQSFIRSLSAKSGDRAIIHAVIVLGRSLGLRVVAEGVENAEQLALLGELDCDMAQGFHFSKPLPPQEIQVFLRKRPWLSLMKAMPAGEWAI